MRRLAYFYYSTMLEQTAFPQSEPLTLLTTRDIPLAEKYDMIETSHISLVLSMVYKLLPLRNICEIRLQISTVKFCQIIKAELRQLLFKSRQVIFPQVFVIYG